METQGVPAPVFCSAEFKKRNGSREEERENKKKTKGRRRESVKRKEEREGREKKAKNKYKNKKGKGGHPGLLPCFLPVEKKERKMEK